MYSSYSGFNFKICPVQHPVNFKFKMKFHFIWNCTHKVRVTDSSLARAAPRLSFRGDQNRFKTVHKQRKQMYDTDRVSPLYSIRGKNLKLRECAKTKTISLYTIFWTNLSELEAEMLRTDGQTNKFYLKTVNEMFIFLNQSFVKFLVFLKQLSCNMRRYLEWQTCTIKILWYISDDIHVIFIFL